MAATHNWLKKPTLAYLNKIKIKQILHHTVLNCQLDLIHNKWILNEAMQVTVIRLQLQ